MKIPIIEQQDSRMKQLAVKAEEWNEPGVREGLYAASLIYMKTHGNDSSGSKLNSSGSIRFERGEVIGEEAGVIRKSVDARGWYHAMKQKISRRAFFSPLEAMEMLMAINGEKVPKFRITPGTAGEKRMYATLNIMADAAIEQIECQMRKNEKDEDVRLLENYASRLKTPTFAYLRGGGFKG